MEDYKFSENSSDDIDYQAIADDMAYQAWKDLPIDNPKLYKEIIKKEKQAGRKKDFKKRNFNSKW